MNQEIKKITSCGILFFENNQLLMCHPTGHNNDEWDLPKGCMDESETYINAAIRECFEETGFICHPDNLIDLGMHEYQSHKDLYLFKHTDNHAFKLEEAVCNSQFLCKKTNHWLPEHDDFAYFSFDEVLNRACKQLRTVLSLHLKLNC